MDVATDYTDLKAELKREGLVIEIQQGSSFSGLTLLQRQTIKMRRWILRMLLHQDVDVKLVTFLHGGEVGCA